MTAANYELGADASPLDRATLPIFRWWQRSGRDFFRSFMLTQLGLMAVLITFLAAVPGSRTWNQVGAAAALFAPVAAWIAHRRRYNWQPVVTNERARKWGIWLGVGLIFVTGWVFGLFLTYFAVLIGMLSAQGPLGLLPAVATGAAGWFAASYRKRQIDDPIYP